MKAANIYSIIILIVVIVVLGVVGYYVYTNYMVEDATTTNTNISSYNINLYTYNSNVDFSNINSSVTNVENRWLRYDSSLSIQGDKNMQLKLVYLDMWNLEYRNSPNVLNFFNKTSDTVENLNNSVVFVNYYEADNFLAQFIVDLDLQESILINNYQVVVYEAIKKGDPYEDRPIWFNQIHPIYEIQSGNRIYTIDFKPGTDEVVIDRFLNNIEII